MDRIIQLRNREQDRKSAQQTKESMLSLVAEYLPPDIKKKNTKFN